MATFEIRHSWSDTTGGRHRHDPTMGLLTLRAGETVLTENADPLSRTFREAVPVSAYALAAWFASAWWRLISEPLPAPGVHPTTEWRMNHELGAAGHGFAWPRILFVSDLEDIQIFAASSSGNPQQFIRYLNALPCPASVTLHEFQDSVAGFIDHVIARLDAMGEARTDLKALWQTVRQEREDQASAIYRSMEAAMGFDPDECPPAIMKWALSLAQRTGLPAFAELAPVYGKAAGGPPLAAIDGFRTSHGIIGRPQFALSATPTPGHADANTIPLCDRATAAAQQLREVICNRSEEIDNETLYGLFCTREADIERWVPAARRAAAVAVPHTGKAFKLFPRKRHPVAKRFEWARLIADYLYIADADGHWLATTDLRTARQTYQRIFAAEFLCPFDALEGVLAGEYSETAVEEAAEYYGVSTATVSASLARHGRILPVAFGSFPEGRLPYTTRT